MKKNKIVPGIVFILSISFNVAFIIHMLTAKAAYTGETENQLTLNLTEQQKKSMEPIRTQMHRENEAIKKQISQYQEKLLEALKKEPVDREVVNGCIEKISNLQKKIQQNTIEEIIRIKKYMNTEQCNCLIEDLGTSLNHASKPCDCTHCNPPKE